MRLINIAIIAIILVGIASAVIFELKPMEPNFSAAGFFHERSDVWGLQSQMREQYSARLNFFSVSQIDIGIDHTADFGSITRSDALQLVADGFSGVINSASLTVESETATIRAALKANKQSKGNILKATVSLLPPDASKHQRFWGLQLSFSRDDIATSKFVASYSSTATIASSNNGQSVDISSLREALLATGRTIAQRLNSSKL